MANSDDRTPEENLAEATCFPADDVQPGSRLPRAADLYESLFLEHPDGVVLTVEGKISLVNDRFVEMSGYSAEDIIGMDPSDLVAPEERERADERVRALLEKRPEYASAYTLLRKDKSRIPVDVHSKPVEHNGEAAIISVVRDISERKKAEEALRESETLYQTLFFGSPDGVVLIVEGQITLINDRFAEMSGYSSEEAIGMAPSELVSADERDRVDNRIWAITAGSQEPLAEYFLIRKDGSSLAIDVDSRSIQHGGKPAVLTVVRDISERKKAEEALLESEATNRALLGAMPDMIFRVNREGTHIGFFPGTANPHIPPSEFIGRNLRETVPTVAGQIMQAIGQALESHETQTLTYDVPTDEGIRSLESRISVCGKDEVLLIVRDVSKEKQAEVALRALEQERYRRLLEVAPEGIVIIDDAGVIETVNARTEELFGYDRRELIGRPLSLLIPERFRQQHLAHQAAYAAAPRPRTLGPDLELYGLRKDGSEFPADISLNALQTEAGLSIIAAVRDVTERTKAEKTLRESEARFSTAFHDNPVAVAISRIRDGKIIDLNDAFLSLTGLRRAETTGRTAVEVGFLFEPGVREEVVAEVRKSGTVRDYPVQIKRKTGEMLDVLSTITQIEIDNEPCLLITNIDITERKRLEAELQSLRDDLESKVERRMEGDNPYKLTFREYTVLHLVAAGKADKEIAAELAISVYTVHRHVSHILTKMDSPSRTEAGTRALREGLLD